MNDRRARSILLLLSVILALIVTYTSLAGIFTPGVYAKETPNWQAQSIGQDIVDLCLVIPVLIISSLLAYRGSRYARIVWAGTNLYLVYTFVLYCFDVHFNRLFIFYCLSLGLSFYSFLLFLFWQIREPVDSLSNRRLISITGIYFIAVSVLFYGLWLGETLPAILKHEVPVSLQEAGLFTNGVHVLDLSIILPGIFLTGLLLLQKNKLGFILTPVLLIFMFLMDLTICALILILLKRGLEANLAIAGIMIAIAIFTMILIGWHFKEMKMSND